MTNTYIGNFEWKTTLTRLYLEKRTNFARFSGFLGRAVSHDRDNTELDFLATNMTIISHAHPLNAGKVSEGLLGCPCIISGNINAAYIAKRKLSRYIVRIILMGLRASIKDAQFLSPSY